MTADVRGAGEWGALTGEAAGERGGLTDKSARTGLAGARGASAACEGTGADLVDVRGELTGERVTLAACEGTAAAPGCGGAAVPASFVLGGNALVDEMLGGIGVPGTSVACESAMTSGRDAPALSAAGDERADDSLERACACAERAGLALRMLPEGLALTDGTLELRGDFTRMLPRLRATNLARELLVRAARVRGVAEPTAVDATAGLGEDSLLLAAAGFEVTLFESNPVIAALLADALRRAAEVPELASVVARMRLVEGDSVQGLSELGRAPDVVYLDPMFPERTKSAAVKKKFQLLHHLEAPCSTQEELLGAALGAGPRKVVVKRPAKGELLAGAKPSYALAGKAVRYDVIVPPRG